MKHNLNFLKSLVAITALGLSFTQASFAQEQTELSAAEIRYNKIVGYDRWAYQQKLKSLSESDLSMEKTGPYLKSKVACAGTILLNFVTGVFETVPLLNVAVKAIAVESSDDDLIKNMDGPDDRFHTDETIKIESLILGGAATVALEGVGHSVVLAGSAAVDYLPGIELSLNHLSAAPSRSYTGTRIANEGISRVMGCRQSLLKLEDIESELKVRRDQD